MDPGATSGTATPPPASGSVPADPSLQAVAAEPQTADQYLSMRERLDQELWSAEVDAQRHEEPFIRLWDALRTLESEYKTAREFPFRQIRFATPRLATTHPLQINEFHFDHDIQTLSWPQWLERLAELEGQGYRLLQSEWHHSNFQPRVDGIPAESTVSFMLDLRRSEPLQRISVRGNLRVVWSDEESSGALPQPATIEVA